MNVFINECLTIFQVSYLGYNTGIPHKELGKIKTPHQTDIESDKLTPWLVLNRDLRAIKFFCDKLEQ
ncbi:12668_t:CDS:2 [Racocetra persica]|uniref:12668_t:CDS:1 n=1 Tax=Racocetra persica TaxID=160502 RepID=A0ACA9RDX2_9GLOM|nr:12668_t:CDS:2 [Racocetra persica]